MATAAVHPALDRASNIGIFQAVATPHMVDAGRIELLRENHELSELPLGRAALEPDAASITNIIQSGIEASVKMTEYPLSPRPNSSDSATAAVWPLSGPSPPTPVPTTQVAVSPRHDSAGSRSRTPQQIDDILADLRSIASSGGGGDAPVSRPGSAVSDDEFVRLHHRATATATATSSLDHMRASYATRSGGTIEDVGAKSSYTKMFRDLCRTRHISGGGPGTVVAPHCDKDYSEKRELLIKLDELRALGYSVPNFTLQMPLEDLQSEYNRRTVSTSTVATVETVSGWLCTAATMIESLNRLAGPLLPMDNYGENVKAQMMQPRAKYALYQIVLRWQGRSGSSPYRELLTILLLPLIQGILVKVVQWLAKGRVPLPATSISSGISSLFSMTQSDPNAGVPSGIAGISPDTPAPAGVVPDLPTTTNPFKPPGAPKSAENPKSKPNPFAAHMVQEANRTDDSAQSHKGVAAFQRRRPKLQRPGEIRAGMVYTKPQARALGV
jgi:hypothetical protein